MSRAGNCWHEFINWKKPCPESSAAGLSLWIIAYRINASFRFVMTSHAYDCIEWATSEIGNQPARLAAQISYTLFSFTQQG
jgi:hypothetical protein